ncbi:MAG TPA: tetratricopeptide repeat protein [Candidatus Binatia bacterium]
MNEPKHERFTNLWLARRTWRTLAALAVAVALAGPAHAAGDDDPLPTPTPGGNGGLSAEALANQGRLQAQAGEWAAAEASYRAAIARRADLPEAWNGLGHALKSQRRFDEAIAAYDEALRLRPDYPQALEYLGETYVMMGEFKKAEDVLARLRPLDAKLAAQLAHAITTRSQHASW